MGESSSVVGLQNLIEISDADGTLREAAFSALLGLAQKHVGDRPFFGDAAASAEAVYRKSLIGASFPRFWLEVPLLGTPGFDLHVYYDRDTVGRSERFALGDGFGMQPLFDWFFGTETGGVGVGFAHDLRGADRATGAYVNFLARPLSDLRGFFASLGDECGCERAEALLTRLPRSWYPWYLGVFPHRSKSGVRLGAFVSQTRQEAYAADQSRIAEDLLRAGFSAFDDSLLARLSVMAAMPFRLELQLDACEDGVGETLGADLALGMLSPEAVRAAFAATGSGGAACKALEGWGVADERWRCIPDAALSRIFPLVWEGKDQLLLISCLPAFIKEKWVAGEPQPAKVYFQCLARPFVVRPK